MRWVQLIRVQNKLRELTLSCARIDDSVVYAALTHGDRLTHLGLHKVKGECSNSILMLLVTQCTALKTLCVDDRSLLLIPELRHVLGRDMPSLQIVPDPIYPPPWDSPLWSESIY
jgi:hypothetical protein